MTNVSCNCVSGVAGKCKHIFALIHYINTDRSSSKTSVEQEWGKPTDAQLGKEKYAKPLVISEEFFQKEATCVTGAKPYNISYSDVKSINCPLQSILKFQTINANKLFINRLLTEMLSTVISMCEKSNLEICVTMLIILSSSSQLYLPQQVVLEERVHQYYDQKIKLSHEEIQKVCCETVQQSDSYLWFETRRVRISASSKAHAIKTRQKKTVSALVNDFLSTGTKKGLASLEYGLKHEKEAISEYVLQTNAVVQPVGAFVMPFQPWICVSADGLVIEDYCVTKILEIKCPSSCHSKRIFEPDTKKLNVGYLYLDNDVVQLKSSHVYYTQCQMLMYATGLNECDLFVWSSKGSCLVSVDRDENFLQHLIPKINEFYFTHFLPSLCDKDSTDKENVTTN